MGLLKWLGFDGACEKEPVSLNDKNFAAEVRKSPIPVMVDVWSDGCAPCMSLVPTVKRIACKYDGKIKVAELNVAAGRQTTVFAVKLKLQDTSGKLKPGMPGDITFALK